jgi:hypothetical protein
MQRMPTVNLPADTLNQMNAQFSQQALPHPVFLNSVPKCGTHLLRNILRMFVPPAQQYHPAFIQIPILGQHLNAFDSKQPKLSWGHLLFSDESAMALHGVKQLLLVRDPYDWVLARARFFVSDTFQGSLEHLKGGRISPEELFNMMIFGIYQKAPSLQEIYTHNAVAWLGTAATLIRYEDLSRHLRQLDSPAAQVFFSELLKHLGIDSLPADWQQRVLVGADRQQSGTARENLKGTAFYIPEELPRVQKQLVEYAAPGLRRILGYC